MKYYIDDLDDFIITIYLKTGGFCKMPFFFRGTFRQPNKLNKMFLVSICWKQVWARLKVKLCKEKGLFDFIF